MATNQRIKVNWLSIGVVLALVTMGLNLATKFGPPPSLRMWLHILSYITGALALLPLAIAGRRLHIPPSDRSKWEQFAIMTRWWLFAYCLVMLLVRGYLAFRLHTFHKEFDLLLR